MEHVQATRVSFFKGRMLEDMLILIIFIFSFTEAEFHASDQAFVKRSQVFIFLIIVLFWLPTSMLNLALPNSSGLLHYRDLVDRIERPDSFWFLVI